MVDSRRLLLAKADVAVGSVLAEAAITVRALDVVWIDAGRWRRRKRPP